MNNQWINCAHPIVLTTNSDPLDRIYPPDEAIPASYNRLQDYWSVALPENGNEGATVTCLFLWLGIQLIYQVYTAPKKSTALFRI